MLTSFHRSKTFSSHHEHIFYFRIQRIFLYIFNLAWTIAGLGYLARAMLQALPKEFDRIFGHVNSKTPSVCLAQQRKKIAIKLANPRIAKIHFHLIRHWFATMEYYKNKNMRDVQRKLGHKSLLNTEIYVNLEEAMFEVSDDYIVKAALTIEEARKLLEIGFEYVTDMDGKKLFRKNK